VSASPRACFPSSQLKGSVSLLFKSLASFRQILAIGTIREQIFGRFLFGENIFHQGLLFHREEWYKIVFNGKR